MIVAIAVGRPGLNVLLVGSQVALSVVLPFVAFPLILLTSTKSVMRVRKPPASEAEKPCPYPEPTVDELAGSMVGTDPVDPVILEVDIAVSVMLFDEVGLRLPRHIESRHQRHSIDLGEVG